MDHFGLNLLDCSNIIIDFIFIDFDCRRLDVLHMDPPQKDLLRVVSAEDRQQPASVRPSPPSFSILRFFRMLLAAETLKLTNPFRIKASVRSGHISRTESEALIGG